MSKAGRDTDERLKSWLSSQTDQERLCIGLVSVLGGYINIAPRRPLGGPDGARDIQATALASGRAVWFGVGFLKVANDTKAQRTQIVNKCKGDIDAALKENPALQAFGFFTNVDLKPAEESDLRAYAKAKSIDGFEIYNRERLRSILDSPAGYGLRLEFLDIPMDKEQQLAWLASHHSRLEQLQTVTRRMESMLEIQNPLRLLIAYVKFTPEFDLSAHGPFAISIQIGAAVDFKDEIKYVLGFAMYAEQAGGASSLTWRPSLQTGDHGSAMFMEQVLTAGKTHLVAKAFFRPDVKTLFARHGVSTVRDMESLCAVIHVSEGLAAHLAEVGIFANTTRILVAGPSDWQVSMGGKAGHWPSWEGWEKREWVELQSKSISLIRPDLLTLRAWNLDAGFLSKIAITI